jgi:hypothetical protein
MIAPVRSGVPGSFIPSIPASNANRVAPPSAIDSFESPADAAQVPDASTASPAMDADLLQQLIGPLITALLSAMKSIFEGLAKSLNGKDAKSDGKVGTKKAGGKKASDHEKARGPTKTGGKDKGKKAGAKGDRGSASGYHGKGAEYLKSRGSHTVGSVHGLSAAEAYIIQHESGGNPRATNPSSGAFGIWQGLGSTLTSEAHKFGFNPHTTNVNEQLIMFRDYVKNRYGTPEKAMAFWKAHNWY